MNWSNVIMRLRKKLLLTQSEFAELINVSFAAVNRWENGHNEPTIKMKRNIKKLCIKNGIEFDSEML